MDIAAKLQKMSDFIVARSYPFYNENCGHCAKAVREGIEAGFNPQTLIRTNAAKDYGPSLEKFGFQKIITSTKKLLDYKPKVGDIAIIQYEPYGHICAYCESIFPKTGKKFKGWVSDFQQLDMYGGKIRNKLPEFSIYRYSKQI